ACAGSAHPARPGRRGDGHAPGGTRRASRQLAAAHVVFGGAVPRAAPRRGGVAAYRGDARGRGVEPHGRRRQDRDGHRAGRRAGQPPAAPYEVLESPRFGELISEARQKYDYVLLDTPPIVSVPDCRVIGKWVDGFLIVVAAHQTRRKLLEEALNLMEPAKVIG